MGLDRLPNEVYPAHLGPYPSPAGVLRCQACAAREGDQHDSQCVLFLRGTPHVSFQRRAFEAAYRKTVRTLA